MPGRTFRSSAGRVLCEAAIDVREKASRLSQVRRPDRIVDDGRTGYADDFGQSGGDQGQDPLLFVRWAVRENLDVSIGRRVAQAVGLPHTTIPITRDFFRQFDRIADDVVLSTDGNLEMSGAPNIFVNRIAREISPIRLTGNYGSEVLRRHRAFSPSSSIRRVLGRNWAESVDHAAVSWRNSAKRPSLELRGFPADPVVQLQPAPGRAIGPEHEISVHG